MTTLPQPHYRRVRHIHRRMIATHEVHIGNVARPKMADPQSPPNNKESALIGSRDSAPDIEKIIDIYKEPRCPTSYTTHVQICSGS